MISLSRIKAKYFRVALFSANASPNISDLNSLSSSQQVAVPVKYSFLY